MIMVMMHTTQNMDQSNVFDEAAGDDVEFLDKLEIQTILTPWN